MDAFVYPNPFTALDPKGWPTGRTFVNPAHPRPYDVIGGKLRREVLKHDEGRDQKKSDGALREVRETRVRVHVETRMRPHRVPLDQYAHERVACGDLIAADKATAQGCAIPGKDFRAPIDVLNAALAARIDEWKACHALDDPPAIAGYVLVQEGDEIKLVRRAKKPRPAPPPEDVAPPAPPPIETRTKKRLAPSEAPLGG